MAKDQTMRDDLNEEIVPSYEGIHAYNEREYPAPCAQPCNECPWRRNSVSGHIGPYKAEDWPKQAHSDTAIACHKTLPEGGGWGTSTKQCKGAAIFRANVCKQPRNPSITTGPEDHDAVFSNNDEFVAHHDPGSPAIGNCHLYS